MPRIFKPKTLEGREYERWIADVSKQVDAGQPLSDNEVMTFMLSYENKPVVTQQDLQDARIETNSFATGAQTARNAMQTADDAALLAYMGGW